MRGREVLGVRGNIVLVLALLVVMSSSACAYEILTHEKISESATRRSIVNNEKFLNFIGLEKDAFDSSQAFPAGNGEDLSIGRLIRVGSALEDHAPESFFSSETKRPLRHFFDPYRDIPLSLPGWSPDKSPDWALEDGEEIPIQSWSLADARTYFYRAIWSSSEAERALWYGALFRSLGHVIHHVQDMAQPQHARDDDHLRNV